MNIPSRWHTYCNNTHHIHTHYIQKCTTDIWRSINAIADMGRSILAPVRWTAAQKGISSQRQVTPGAPPLRTSWASPPVATATAVRQVAAAADSGGDPLRAAPRSTARERRLNVLASQHTHTHKLHTKVHNRHLAIHKRNC